MTQGFTSLITLITLAVERWQLWNIDSQQFWQTNGRIEEMDVAQISKECDKRPSFRTASKWVSCFTLLLGFWISGTASATVTVEYRLTPNSSLITPIADNPNSFFSGTGSTPTWLPGSAGTPPVNYNGDTPQTTLNRMVVEFPDDGSGNIIDGVVTITLMDFYHPVDAGISGLVDITGINDSSYAGAVGNMVGGVVTGWTTDFTLYVHNELTCDDGGANSICTTGVPPLPPSGDTLITHEHNDIRAIDTLASPDPASLPMAFNVDFTTVTMEMTIGDTLGRQYYDISGSALPPPVPLSDTGLQMLMIGLMALAGFYALHSGRVSPFQDAS
jgi:hypothetical protein